MAVRDELAPKIPEIDHYAVKNREDLFRVKHFPEFMLGVLKVYYAFLNENPDLDTDLNKGVEKELIKARILLLYPLVSDDDDFQNLRKTDEYWVGVWDSVLDDIDNFEIIFPEDKVMIGRLYEELHRIVNSRVWVAGEENVFVMLRDSFPGLMRILKEELGFDVYMSRVLASKEMNTEPRLVARFWDMAHDWYGDEAYEPLKRSVFELAENRLFGDDSDGKELFLDIGVGEGEFFDYLPIVVEGIGCDRSKFMISDANIHDLCNANMSDALNLSYKNNSFDRVACLFTAHWIDSKGLLIKEIYRVLKEGGVGVISLRRPERENCGDESWKTYYKNLCNKAGFTKIIFHEGSVDRILEDGSIDKITYALIEVEK